MNTEKARALLEWVNAIQMRHQVKSLKEFANTQLLLEIVCLIDKDFQVKGTTKIDDYTTNLAHVMAYLENFYHQPLAEFIDQKRLIDTQDILEIAKVLCLLLSCAVQGEHVSECVDKITSLEENLQFQLKSIIEAVLKDLDHGKIDSTSIRDVLCRSESIRDVVQPISEEYKSSPIVMSPIPFFNSPIKTLMASPQMQSRQSQVTISKLYKRLNQFQIQSNNLQRIQADLQHEIQEKNKQIQQQELQIRSLSKEVTKVPGLQEEVESLTHFETEISDINRKCYRLTKSTKELQYYKDNFLKLEGEFAALTAEKGDEKSRFEKRLSDIKYNSKEELQSVQTLLDDANKTCHELRAKLQEALATETSVKTRLEEQQKMYLKEIEQLKKALADSEVSRKKLCCKNDQDVLRQIAREADLKQCFREQEAALQCSLDQIQLENCELRRDLQELQNNLEKEQEIKRSVESKLVTSDTRLTEATSKYERLQFDFVSLGNESKCEINKIREENESMRETVEKSRAELEDKLRCLVKELDETKLKLSQASKDREQLQFVVDTVSQENNSLVEDNTALKKKLDEREILLADLKRLQDSSVVLTNENFSLLKENSSLKSKVDQFEILPVQVDGLQDAWKMAKEKYMSAIQAKEGRVRELELQDEVNHSTNERMNSQIQNLQNKMAVLDKENKSLKESEERIKAEFLSEKAAAEEQNQKSKTAEEDLKLQIEEFQERIVVLEKENNSLLEKKSLSLNEQARAEGIAKEMMIVEEGLRLQIEELQDKMVVLEKENNNSKECEEKIRLKFLNEQARAKELEEALRVREEELNLLKQEFQDKMVVLQEENTNLKECRENSRSEFLSEQARTEEASKLRGEELYFQIQELQNKIIVLEKENNNSKECEEKSRVKFLNEQARAKELDEALRVREEVFNLQKREFQDKMVVLQEENTNLKECREKSRSELLNEKAGTEEASKLREEELNFQIQELQNKIIVVEEENINLKDCREKSRSEFLNEKARTEESSILREKELNLQIQELQKKIIVVEEENINLKDCREKSRSEFLNEKARTEENSILREKELKSQIQELQNKIIAVKEENNNLKECEEKNRMNFLNEQARAKELEENLRVREEGLNSKIQEVLDNMFEVEKENKSLTKCGEKSQAEFLADKASEDKNAENLKITDEGLNLQVKEFRNKRDTLEKDDSNLQEGQEISRPEFLQARAEEIVGEMAIIREGFRLKIEKLQGKVVVLEKGNDKVEECEEKSRMKVLNEQARAEEIQEHFIVREAELNLQVQEFQDKMVALEEENTNLKECREKSRSEFLNEKARAEELTDKLKTTKEGLNSQIEKLHNKMVAVEKENRNLAERQEKCRGELLTEKVKVDELKKDLLISEEVVKKLNDTNVDLKLEMLSLQDQVKKVQQEKMKLSAYVSQVDAKVEDLEKKLAEEEFICKRLSVEIRSLEAQLAHAERQLRGKSENENDYHVYEDSEKRCKVMPENVRKMSPVTEVSTDTEDSAVTDNSLVSEMSLVSENKESSVCQTDRDKTLHSEEVTKKLRRRSAVYSKSNCSRTGANEKRRSTIGTESFIVGQFSNTIADEPDEHNYEWERLLELQKRNSTCLPHLRSSYPVETQVRSKEEVEEAELKFGSPTKQLNRKRLRENMSDSSIVPTSDGQSTSDLSRSQSEDTFSKCLPEKMTAKLSLLKTEDIVKNQNVLSSKSLQDQTKRNDNDANYNRRESIAFKVDITPAKKSRMSLLPRVSHAKAELGRKKETARIIKSKIKPQSSKKYTVQARPVKGNTKPLGTKNTNYAV